MSIRDIKTATITSKGQITLPSEFRKNLPDGTNKVAIIAYDDRIEIRPLSVVEERLGWKKLSDKALEKIWNTPEEDEAWAYLQDKIKDV